MKEAFYPLTCNTWGPEELSAIQTVVDSQKFTMGPEVKKFEKSFAEYFGAKYAVMLSSGSTANLISTASLFYHSKFNLKRGDEVIVPAISWATTYYPLSQYGLKLKFVDVDLNTLNLDIKSLESAVSEKTKMIVVVSILGNPAELNYLRDFCDKRNIILFEDNCESMGAKLDGKYAGTFGHINTFSTFYSHHISTMEGGLILTDDEELYHLAVCLRAHGWTRDVPEGSKLYTKSAEDFYEAYRFILPGYNARPLEFSGAVGSQQLKKLSKMIELRRSNAEYFISQFKDDKRFILQKENGESSWFSFTMILSPEYEVDRRKIFKALKDADIEHRIITGGNFLRHDVIKHIEHEVHNGTPNADLAHDRGFFVGNFPYDIKDKILYLKNTLDKVK